MNLLSVTIRYLPKNTESFLSYSRTDSFAFVLYLNQKMSDEGKREAEQFTRELIDATLQYGSTYYFPYQRYATGAQIRKAYPQPDAFIQKKAVYDPNAVFDNAFFEYYRVQEK